MKTQFGLPDNLPPLNLHDVCGRLWLGFTGLLLLVLSLFPSLVPPPWGSALVLICWLVLPVRGLMNKAVPKSRTQAQKRASNQVILYTLFVVAVGVGFTLWARHLGLPWPVIIGVLFMMEALPSAIVSLTEWWRLSTIGISTGLMVCGFGFPLVGPNKMFVLVGASILFGCLLSAGILYWQVRHNKDSPASSHSSGELV